MAFLTEWGVILQEVGLEKFDMALTNAIRETEFFPSVALIRKQTGMTSEAVKQIEGEAAWNTVQKHLQAYWGRPEGVPKLSDPKIDYAVRACGGNRVLADMDLKAMAFIKRDFIEAYTNAPLAESLKLLGELRLDNLALPLNPPKLPAARRETLPVGKMPEKKQMTEEEFEARRQELKKQAAKL